MSVFFVLREDINQALCNILKHINNPGIITFVQHSFDSKFKLVFVSKDQNVIRTKITLFEILQTLFIECN